MEMSFAQDTGHPSKDTAFSKQKSEQRHEDNQLADYTTASEKVEMWRVRADPLHHWLLQADWKGGEKTLGKPPPNLEVSPLEKAIRNEESPQIRKWGVLIWWTKVFI